MRQANALILYDGVRFKKIANGITTTYYVDGGKILGEDRSDGKKLRYFYDKDGILGFRYYNGSYWADNSYVKDGQGNVIGILSNYRYLRAYYEYDAFGATTKVWGEGMDTSAESFIGSINPFRWKGYYYDTETKLYYMNGRYYDPETALYLDAADASQAILNAYTVFGLDRNKPLCYNILQLPTYSYDINEFGLAIIHANPTIDILAILNAFIGITSLGSDIADFIHSLDNAKLATGNKIISLLELAFSATSNWYSNFMDIDLTEQEKWTYFTTDMVFDISIIAVTAVLGSVIGGPLGSAVGIIIGSVADILWNEFGDEIKQGINDIVTFLRNL